MNQELSQRFNFISGINETRSMIAKRLKEESIDFIEQVLASRKDNRFDFVNDVDCVEIIYDGGAHPEYNANPYSMVLSVYVNKDKTIIVETEDGTSDLSWCMAEECYNIATYMHDHFYDDEE